MANVKKGVLDALIAKLIPKITTLIVDLIPKKTFNQLIKYPTLLEVLLPSIGIGLRAIKGLPESIAEDFTEFFQETNQSIDMRKGREEAEGKGKNNKYSDDSVKQTGKVLNNLMKRKAKKKGTKFGSDQNEEETENRIFNNFLKLIESYPDSEKSAVMNVLNVLGSDELKKLLSYDIDEIRKRINVMYKKNEVPETENKKEDLKKEEVEKDWFDRAKLIIGEVGKAMQKVDKKINKELCPTNEKLVSYKGKERLFFEEQKAKFNKKLEKKWYLLWIR